jgi:glycosyltransferase involved in cell wall biosynthesis
MEGRRQMRVLFYEPEFTGHHFAYLARMLPGFADLPIERLVVTTPEALRSVEYSQTLAPFADDLEFVTCCTPAPPEPVANARHRLRELSEAIRRLQPDHVAVCYVDGIWDQATIDSHMGRRPWPRGLVVEGWLYRGRFGDRSDGRLKSRLRRFLFTRMLRMGLFRKLHLDHELLYEFAKARAAGTLTEVVLTPNPILLGPEMSREEARRRLNLDPAGRWISLSGMIARFKGAPELIHAFERFIKDKCADDVRLLLAGPHEAQVREQLSQEPFATLISRGRIVSLDRFLTEEEMYAVAAASDVVLAPYPQHQGRSSIILWAAAAGRPSLGTDDGCIGYVIRTERLGMICDVLDGNQFAESIRDALEMPWTADDATRVRRYAEFHRVENYRRTAAELTRARLCGAAAPV